MGRTQTGTAADGSPLTRRPLLLSMRVVRNTALGGAENRTTPRAEYRTLMSSMLKVLK